MLIRSFFAALLALLWLLAGCTSVRLAVTPTQGAPSPAERDLAFETIERGDSDYYHFHPLEPQHVFLITSAEEATRLTGWVSREAEKELAQVDYQRYFLIAVFRGHFVSSGYDGIIRRIVRQGDRLVVHVQFWAPSPHYAVTAMDSNPYHLVRVLRDGGPLGEADVVIESQSVTPTPPAEIRRLTPTPRH